MNTCLCEEKRYLIGSIGCTEYCTCQLKLICYEVMYGGLFIQYYLVRNQYSNCHKQPIEKFVILVIFYIQLVFTIVQKLYYRLNTEPQTLAFRDLSQLLQRRSVCAYPFVSVRIGVEFVVVMKRLSYIILEMK